MRKRCYWRARPDRGVTRRSRCSPWPNANCGGANRAQARDELKQALALARQTGLGFIGAALYGLLSRAAGSAAERAQCLADGAALLQQTGLAHNHLWFYRDAIESTLAAGEWQAALDHASALEQAFQVEPLPWVALVVERARAIVAAARTGP